MGFFQVCPEGQYGKLCSFRCGNCLNQDPCYHINGSCLFGCSSGWKGNYCDKSEFHFYFLILEYDILSRYPQKHHLKKTRYLKILIHIVMFRFFFIFYHYYYFFFVDCDPGYFGFECKYTCNNTNCLNNTNCEPSSGHCTSGCFSSWFGPFCQGMLQHIKVQYVQAVFFSHFSFFPSESWIDIHILNIALKSLFCNIVHLYFVCTCILRTLIVCTLSFFLVLTLPCFEVKRILLMNSSRIF